MKIFVLIIVCLFTVFGLISILDDDLKDFGRLIALILFLAGILAIIFQSISMN